MAEKKRGWLLTTWLIIMLIGNGITALLYLIGGQLLILLMPALSMPLWAIYFLGILAVLNFIFTIFLFMWKKWAFYTFCVSAVITFIVNVVIGGNIIFSLVAAGIIISGTILVPPGSTYEAVSAGSSVYSWYEY